MMKREEMVEAVMAEFERHGIEYEWSPLGGPQSSDKMSGYGSWRIVFFDSMCRVEIPGRNPGTYRERNGWLNVASIRRRVEKAISSQQQTDERRKEQEERERQRTDDLLARAEEIKDVEGSVFDVINQIEERIGETFSDRDFHISRKHELLRGDFFITARVEFTPKISEEYVGWRCYVLSRIPVMLKVEVAVSAAEVLKREAEDVRFAEELLSKYPISQMDFEAFSEYRRRG